jgi:mannosidase alpha-like ER degradation enhancer 2
MDSAAIVWPVFNSLQAFWPGLQVLAGDVDPAIRTHTAFFSVWKRYGFTPEGFNLATLSVQYGQKSYPLRPELIESTYWLYKATRDPRYLDAGRDFVASLQYGAKCPCGYCHITDVELHKQEDHMESFFLAETVKYLWLLFDLAVDSDNLVDNGPYKYIFSTEGHLLPITPQISLAREHCSYFGGYCPSNSTKLEQEVLGEDSSNDDHSNDYPYHESFPVTGLIKGLCPGLTHAQKYGFSYVLPEKTDREDVNQPKPVVTSSSIVLISDQTVEKRPQEEEGFTSQSEPIMTISGGSSNDQTGQELTLLESETDDQRSYSS